jgi:hypothetical protein
MKDGISICNSPIFNAENSSSENIQNNSSVTFINKFRKRRVIANLGNMSSRTNHNNNQAAGEYDEEEIAGCASSVDSCSYAVDFTLASTYIPAILCLIRTSILIVVVSR